MAFMRNSILPGLLIAASYNEKRQIKNFKLFEIGAIHNHSNKSYTKTNEKFHLGLWKNIKNKTIECWQYIVLIEVGFNEEQLNDICEFEKIWEEAEEFYAPKFDLERNFNLHKIAHQPEGFDDKNELKMITIDEVCEAIGEVAEFTKLTNKKITSKKVKSSKKDPLSMF